MIGVALALSLLAAPAEREKLLVLDVRGVEIEKEQADTLTNFITARAARFEALEVVSSADLRELVDLQAENVRAGCDDDGTACMAELAGALGARLVLSARAGKLDGVYLVTLTLFDARSGSAQGRESVQAWSLADLPEKLGPAVDDMLERATGTTPRADAGSETAAAQRLDPAIISALRIGGGVGAAVGTVLFSVGAIPGVIYAQKKSDLVAKTPQFSGDAAQLAEAQRLHKEAVDARDLYNGAGRFAVISGVVLVVAGTASLVSSFFLEEAP